MLSGPNNPTEECTQLREYCGGTYVGIIDKLDYLQNLGVDAIWISPMVANIERGYHGYWAENIYDLNSNFGNIGDLLTLVNECHQR